MAEQSGIAWTHSTYNPWWGCTEVSPACDHCYARILAHRYGYGWGPEAERRFFGEKHWQEPLRWNARAQATGEPWRVFCGSMCDLYERLPRAHPQRDLMDAERRRLHELIEATPALTWMLLTKRPQNIMRMVPAGWLAGFPPNVWAGTTAEDQEWFDRRWRRLRRVPAGVRFVSYEPALGPLDLGAAPCHNLCWDYPGRDHRTRCLCADRLPAWVILGTESGAGRRPMQLDWARSVLAQCRAAGVAAFVKQVQPNGLVMHDMVEFPPDLRVREFPQ